MRIRHITGKHAGYEVGWINRDVSPDPDDEIDKTYSVEVPVRKANPQVLHIEQLQAEIESKMEDIENEQPGKFEAPANGIGPAELAVQMLQVPYHQRFSKDGKPRPLDTMAPFKLHSQYLAATLKHSDGIRALSEKELDELKNPGMPVEGGDDP